MKTILCCLMSIFAASTACALTPGDVEACRLGLAASVANTNSAFGGVSIEPQFDPADCGSVSPENAALIGRAACDSPLAMLRDRAKDQDVKDFISLVKTYRCGCGNNELDFMGGVLEFHVNPDSLDNDKVRSRLEDLVDEGD